MVIFLGALLMKSICASKSSFDGGAKQAIIHGSTSTMELDKLLGDRSDDETSIENEEEKDSDDEETAGQEIQPLVDSKASSGGHEQDEEKNLHITGSNLSKSVYIDASAPPEAVSSLLDSPVHTSPGLATILSYFRQRNNHHHHHVGAEESNAETASHSS